MNPRRIVIDGTSYNSVSEMPPDVRRQYEQAMRTVRSGDTNAEPNTTDNLTNLFADKNNDGIPDLIENIPAINVFGGTKFVVDGVEYNSVADLPPEARAKYEQAMSTLDKNQNGVPDFLEGFVKMANQPSTTAYTYGTQTPRQSQPAFASQQRKPTSSTPATAPDTSNGWMIALVGVFLLMLCIAGAAGVWYFFLRG
jgi:hypothetical protein